MAESSLLVEGTDIHQLSDEELYVQLTALGCIVGPIVGTTRKTYERKLAVLLGANVANYSFIDAALQEDIDHDVEPSQAYIDRLAGGDTVRRRHILPEYSDPAIDTEEEDEVVDAPRLYSPSPRPPLRTPDTSYSRLQDSSYTSSLPSSPFAPSSVSSPATSGVGVSRRAAAQLQQEGKVPVESTGGVPHLLLVLISLVLVLGALYYLFVAKSDQDAFASLEHLAKTASDAIEQEKKRSSGKQGL